MIYRITFTVGDSEDSVVIQGDTHEEIRDKAAIELEIRGGINPWSEKLAD